MSKVKIQGNASGTGVFTVTAPDTDVDRELILPDAAGTLLNHSTAAEARLGSDVAVAHTTWVKMLFSDDSTVSGEHKSYDEDGDYDAGNSKFVAPSNGKYLVHASLSYYSSMVDTKVYRAAIYVNGTNVHWSEVDCASNSNYQFPQVTAILKLDATDYVEIYGWQSSGASSNVNATNANSHFKIHRLS